jgi:hypothetical protein
VSPNVSLKTGDLVKNLAKAKKQFSKRSHSSSDRARERSKSQPNIKPIVNKLNTTQPINQDPSYVHLRKKTQEQLSPSKAKASIKTTKSALKP